MLRSIANMRSDKFPSCCGRHKEINFLIGFLIGRLQSGRIQYVMLLFGSFSISNRLAFRGGPL
jgi:hypothetical protein